MATAAPDQRTQLVLRLRRAEGQLRGVQRMLEEDADCAEVLVQLAAVKAAVDKVGLRLISGQLRSCVASGADGCGDDLDATLATLLRYATLAD